VKIVNIVILISLLLCLNYSIDLSARENTFRVFFNDKGPEVFESGSPLYDSTLAAISSKSLIRRKSLLGGDNAVTIEDAPIYEYYIKSIEELNSQILLRLKWRNYIVIKCEDSIIYRIEAFPFVKAVQRTQSKLLPVKSLIHKDRSVIDEILLVNNCGSFDYGMSFFQNYIMNVVELHRLGFTGENILIGLIDTGFDYSYHSTLSHIQVVNQYDFISGDTIVKVEKDDNPAQSNHGTLVLSICGGFANGKLIGPAPFAKYILAKTEDLNSETRIEEDNYAAAVEWMEILGVDIISSSLGYFNYDSTDESYLYSDLNGDFSISSVAINRAVKLGVVCITAAGNSGPNAKTISTPGDADSVITVGGVLRDSTGDVVPWRGTSRGPLDNGNIKPNLAALGAGVVGASLNDANTVILTSGTSTATPLIAGSVALLLSAFPELKPWEVRESCMLPQVTSPNRTILWATEFRICSMQ
jgi:serine protease AprX